MRKKTGEVFRDLEHRDERWEKNEGMQKRRKLEGEPEKDGLWVS